MAKAGSDAKREESRSYRPTILERRLRVGAEKPGKERPYRPTPLESRESVRQRGEIDLSRRQRLMGLRGDLCFPSCQRRRYRRYSHEDASSSKCYAGRDKRAGMPRL